MTTSMWDLPVVRQTWTVSGVLLSMLAQGMVQHCMAGLWPAFKGPDAPVDTDPNGPLWLASSFELFMILGFLSSSILMDIYGRRISYALEIIPGTIGLVLVYFSSDVYTLLIGRVLGGITVGATSLLGTVVIGEYTSAEIRGTFLILKTAVFCWGYTMVRGLEYYFHWRSVAMAALTLNLTAFGMVCTWHESPEWLALRERFYESESTFYWLRGNTKKTKQELEEMINAVKVSKVTNKGTLNMLPKSFFRKEFMKPVFIMFICGILLETSGRHLFPAYPNDILSEIIGDKINSPFFTLSIDLIITIGATCSSILINVTKMRRLLFSTGAAAVTLLIATCTYLFLSSNDFISKDQQWIPIFMLIVYFIIVSLGCTPICFALMGEVFPIAHKASGMFISNLLSSMCTITALKIFPLMLTSIKIYDTFTVFGIIMTLMLLILYFVLPETKNKTLQQIQSYINVGSFHDSNEEERSKIIGTDYSPVFLMIPLSNHL